MNLANALGVTYWQDNRIADEAIAASDPVGLAMSLPAELACAAAELDHFWQDDADPRWQLLLSITHILGYQPEQLMPLDIDDLVDYPEPSLAFGFTAGQAVVLPDLTDMLHQPLLKKQAWHALCQVFTLPAQ